VAWTSKPTVQTWFKKERPGSDARPFCIFVRLIAVALLNLPQAVILPGQYMARIGFQRALVPDLREFVVAELAMGIADQIAHVRVIVVAKCL
jgi:hypothetical protein